MHRPIISNFDGEALWKAGQLHRELGTQIYEAKGRLTPAVEELVTRIMGAPLLEKGIEDIFKV